MKSSRVLAAILAGCAMSAACAIAQPQQPNIALGKSVTFSDAPNYSLSTDPDDARQITDGKYTSLGELQMVENTRAIWVQKGTVGWSKNMPVNITIDLGSVQPISGVSYSTAAGISDVMWPRAIFIAVSDDNKTWRSLGDLVQLSRKNGLPPEKGYANYRFATRELQAKGRYVSLVVVQVPYAFVDEIEVYKGEDARLQQPVVGRTFTDLKSLFKQALPPALALRRVQTDTDDIRAGLVASKLPAAQKSSLTARLNQNIAAASKVEDLPPDFKAILPLSDQHRDVFAVHGEVLASEGFAPLTVWKQHRYQWLPLVAKPIKQSAPQLNIGMLRNQFRSDALLLTNATGKPQIATLQLKGVPRGAQSGWLSVASVAWTDTAQSVPVADAQLPITPQNGAYRVEIPAGMTRKVWLTVDSSKVPAGNYRSTLEISGGGKKSTVPFGLNVSAVAMKKPRMSLSTWEYTNVPSYSGLTLQNRAAAMKLMRSHYMDTTWATGSALPHPPATAFDAQNNLKEKLDFSNFDQWVALWPDARNYFVYAAVNKYFSGTEMNTPEFHARVGSWAKAVSAHIKELGLQPKQVGILLVDEPHRPEQDLIVAAWAKAINATAPELTLFQDPIWLRPDQIETQEAITEADILCFHLPVFKDGGPEVAAYAQNLRKNGKELWLYQATGPVRLYDPQLSYRQLPWHSFSIGGRGVGLWSFGDTGGVPTSWNEYAAEYTTYAPVFMDKNTVYNSLHWDAMREGMQDVEELSMLRDAIATSRDGAWKQRTQRTLDEAVNAVTGGWDGNRDWRKKFDSSMTDAHLQKVRALLVSSKK